MTAPEPIDLPDADAGVPELLTGSAPISIREVGELRSSIPYLLGFYPERSLVVIGLDHDGSVLVTVRADAPMGVVETDACVAQLLPVLDRCAPHRLVIAYCDDYEHTSDDPDVREQTVLAALRAFETVTELAPVLERELGAHGYECAFVWPARPGMPRSVLGPVPQIAVAQVLAGRTLLRSRGELRAQLEPIGGAPRTAVREHLQALEGTRFEPIDLVAIVTDILEQHAEAAAAGRGLPQLDAYEVAMCARALREVGVRDVLITLLAQEREWWRIEPWLRVTQLVPTAHVAAAATMTGIVAYLMGDGAQALCAFDLALSRDPGYSLARMIETSLRAGLHPSELRSVLASTFDEAAS